MTRGALRLYAGDPERCAESPAGAASLQLPAACRVAPRSRPAAGGGRVVRTLRLPSTRPHGESSAPPSRPIAGGKAAGLLLLHVARSSRWIACSDCSAARPSCCVLPRACGKGCWRKQDQPGRVSRDQLACLRRASPARAWRSSPRTRSWEPGGAIRSAIARSLRGADRHRDVPRPRRGPADTGAQRHARVRAARDSNERVATYDPAHGASEELKMRYEARLRTAAKRARSPWPSPRRSSSRRAASPRWRACCTGGQGPGEVPEARAVEAANPPDWCARV